MATWPLLLIPKRKQWSRANYLNWDWTLVSPPERGNLGLKNYFLTKERAREHSFPKLMKLWQSKFYCLRIYDKSSPSEWSFCWHWEALQCKVALCKHKNETSKMRQYQVCHYATGNGCSFTSVFWFRVLQKCHHVFLLSFKLKTEVKLHHICIFKIH